MATGDQNDILQRLQATLPAWFGVSSPNLDSILTGMSVVGAFGHSLFQYAQIQTRIKTATGAFLDIVSSDYFGKSLLRKQNEPDALFRARIIANLFREKGTRKAIIQVLQDITGRAPVVFEQERPADTGAYRAMMGYGVAGRYGSMLLPYQCFVDAYRPAGSGIPMVAGYGIPSGGYSTPSRAEYASISMVTMSVQDAEVYGAIDAVKPAGTVIWTRINN